MAIYKRTDAKCCTYVTRQIYEAHVGIARDNTFASNEVIGLGMGNILMYTPPSRICQRPYICCLLSLPISWFFRDVLS